MRPRNVDCWHSARFALRPLLAVFVPALIAGCAISLVAPYDEAIDKQLTELHLRTRVFLAKMSGTRGAYGNNIAFYREAHAYTKGEINDAQAKILLRMQSNASQSVLTAVRTIGMIAAQDAINAAIGVVREAVNKAVGIALL